MIGLGNPGPDYEGTRHNLGFEVVRRVAAELGLGFQVRPQVAAVARRSGAGREALLICPLTFMNRSGRSLAVLDPELCLEPARILVVCDDLALPAGRLRLRRKGSDGGHKGLRSIEEQLGTQAYPRLRVGVGSNPSGEAAEEYVLARAEGEEAEQVQKAVALAVQGVLTWLDSAPLDDLMGRLNQASPARDAEGEEPQASPGPEDER